ncbi:MAG: right-handed parallel beta-helix repeat-containing protein [Bacteroidales bacterium]|nr:right-handed parallel beta-helix repeat-containing protein [Bacteroidales bacterium]
MMKNKIQLFWTLCAWVCVWMFFTVTTTSCDPHGFNDDAQLVFSTDTLMFDTVFTTTTSITRNFTVTNPTADPVKLDIYLAGGNQSYYSINVDGVAGTEFHDVEIAPHDSVFVFVKVTINPTNQNNPYLVTDSVVFRNKERQQAVQLVAFGQDAHFIIPDHLTSSMHYKIVAHEHEDIHWTNDKPWVIYGWAVVDSLGKLTIDPGTRVYVHSGGGIWVYRYGNIQVNGTADQPVYFAGDRLESFYATDYAQWDRIWINEGSQDNVIRNAVITNAAIGLQVSALEEYLSNKTIVSNTIIQNNKNIGVLARAANLEMTNCQISNNGEYSMALQVGDFKLNHLTVANYFSQSPRKNPAVLLTNYYQTTEVNAAGEYENVYLVGETNLECNNSIIYGYNQREFMVSTTEGANCDYTLRNCLVRRDTMNNHYINCFNRDPQFVAESLQDYNLKEESPAIDAGMSGLGITTDLLGRMRNGLPDLGAYEYYPAPSEKRHLVYRR